MSALNHLGFNRAGKAVHALGYGRRRRRRGGAIMDHLKKLHEFAKKRRLVSGALNHLGFNRAGKAVHALGYGRRYRRR